jgi:hypothetical protein
MDELLEELAIKDDMLKDLQIENAALRREVDSWHRRCERAEKDALKWKKTSDEWRQEWMKRSGSEKGRLQREP